MNTRERVAHIVAIGVLVVLFSSCSVPMALWVIPGSTANDLVFGFSGSRKSKAKVKPGSIKVFPCSAVGKQPDGSYFPSDKYAVWAATVPDGKHVIHAYAKATNHIAYGRDEFGLRTEIGPQPLTARGCYVALAYANDAVSGADAVFKIGDDGVVLEVTNQRELVQIFDKKVFDK